PPTLRSSLARSTPKATSRSSLSRQTISQASAVRHGMLHGCRRRLLAVNADDTSMFEDLELQLAAECSGRDLLEEAAVAIGSHAHRVNTGCREGVPHLTCLGLHIICALSYIQDCSADPSYSPDAPHNNHSRISTSQRGSPTSRSSLRSSCECLSRRFRSSGTRVGVASCTSSQTRCRCGGNSC
ncbi:hypothetical protein OH76DRAFT_1508596, partial [Lentinus brumalis]